MSRIREIQASADYPPEVGPEEREAFESFVAHYTRYSSYQRSTGKIMSNWATMLNNPILAKHVLTLSDYIVRDMEWTQRRNLRELVVAVLNKRLHSHFSQKIHFRMAVETGLSLEQLGFLDFWEESELFDEEEKLVIAYTHALMDGTVADELFERVKSRYGERGTLEFTVAVAYWTFWLMIINALEPDAPPATGIAALGTGAGGQ